MDQAVSMGEATVADHRLSDTIARERNRLLNFIRRRVRDVEDAEDILQDVFSELVEATRLMTPIEHVSGWLFRVARNRIADLFRSRRAHISTDDLVIGEEHQRFEDLLPSPAAGPEAAYAHRVLLEELEAALEELPVEQREVFIAHELDGRTFRELAAATGLSVNTLLARKHYAVRRLRKRLEAIYEEFAHK
jgi:RNA polymerase sigma factor (sigma-70 family)